MRFRTIGFSLALALLITIFISTEGRCRDKYFSVNMGSSYRLGDNGSDWEKGLCLGVNMTERINNQWLYGMRASFGRWLPVCEEIGAAYSDPEIVWQSCGTVSYAEFAPYLRFAPEFIEEITWIFTLKPGLGYTQFSPIGA